MPGNGNEVPVDTEVSMGSLGEIGLAALEVPNLTARALPKWRKAVGRVLSGSGRGRVLLIGASAVMGMGAGSGDSGFAGARPRNFPSSMARALAGMGIPVSHEGFFGDQNLPANLSYAMYDTRLEFSVPGMGRSDSFLSLGGRMFRTNDGAYGANLSFTPGKDVDTIIAFLVRDPSYTFVRVDTNGNTLGTLSTQGTSGVVEHTYNLARGRHKFTITQNGNSRAAVIGCLAYDSAVPAVDIVQSARAGSPISPFNDTSRAWSIGNMYGLIAPDLTIIQSITNDAIYTAPAVYEASLRALIAKLRSAGSDVLLMTSLPGNPAATPTAQFVAINTRVRNVATELGLPFLDLYTFLGASFAEAHARYGMFDAYHGSATLYGAEGLYVARALAEMAL